jgi:hypothetical protein
MATVRVEVPGTDSVTITVGDMLVIEFVENCCFCCNPTQVDFFFPQLPLGDHVAGTIWSGAARQSGTINFGHKPYGGECNARGVSADAGRTITVGDGG